MIKIKADAISISRSVMAGLFAGIAAAIINVLFVFIYRSATRVIAYDFVISPFFIFVGVPLLLTLFGFIFFILNRYLPKGAIWYRLFFVLLIIFAVIAGMANQGREKLFAGSTGLLVGLEVITGLITAFFIPFLILHPKFFMTKEGIQATG